MKNYSAWTSHGESPVMQHAELGPLLDHAELDQPDQMHNMSVDLIGDVPPADEQSTPFAKVFYKMVASAKEFVHDNQNHSNPSAISRLIAIRPQYDMSIANYDMI
jgi:hypothetical protein